jgi:hypothetical protein
VHIFSHSWSSTSPDVTVTVSVLDSHHRSVSASGSVTVGRPSCLGSSPGSSRELLFDDEFNGVWPPEIDVAEWFGGLEAMQLGQPWATGAPPVWQTAARARQDRDPVISRSRSNSADTTSQPRRSRTSSSAPRPSARPRVAWITSNETSALTITAGRLASVLSC